MWDGKVFFVLIAAVLASAVVGRLVAAAYRRRVRALMASPAAAADRDAGVPPPALEERQGARQATLRQNRAARRRLALAFVALCYAIGLFQAWWSLTFAYTEGGYGPVKLLLMTLIYGWIAVPALGLLWRWGWARTAAASAAYMIPVGLLAWLRAIDPQQAQDIPLFLLTTIAPVLIAYGLAASGRARATGPYLLPLFLLLFGASVLGTDLLATLVGEGRPGGFIYELVGTLGAVETIAVFALGPWLVAAWPAWRGAGWLAAGYEAGRFSEPVYLLAGYWLVALLIEALAASHGVGPGSLALLAGWSAIPLAVALMRRGFRLPPQPPTLLVLRVFRRDAEVQALFDAVIDRWRYSGRVSLIAGTDLALATLDPDELFAFLGGRLRERFIAGEADLRRRLAALARPADADGRFRVADFYCFDSTWKPALDALVARADVVLMDLRGFAAANAGCIHELAVLARAPHLSRVVVLHDARTDRPAAAAAIGGASGRFVWFDASRIDARRAEALLAALLQPDEAPA